MGFQHQHCIISKILLNKKCGAKMIEYIGNITKLIMYSIKEYCAIRNFLKATNFVQKHFLDI